MEQLEREGGACQECGSTVRLRSLIHLLSTNLFGNSLPLSKWPARPDITGIGISDWYRFEEYFAGKVSYTNMQFDREPFLDITKPDAKHRKTADFIICSEVLEHVAPPARLGFEGLYSMLKPGGVLIFTVPYGLGQTQEHYPDLFDWKLEQLGTQLMLVNTTRSGFRQTFSNLVFHGGWGEVLEMRVFGLQDIIDHFEAAAFTDLHIMEDDVPDYGICFKETWSLPMTARRPLRGKNSSWSWIFRGLIRKWLR